MLKIVDVCVEVGEKYKNYKFYIKNKNYNKNKKSCKRTLN